jgi:hypothetical protein
MNLAMTDSLKVYDILKGAHIPEHQARAITHAIQVSDSARALSMSEILDQRLAAMATKVDLAETKAEILRWMFIFWSGQLVAMVGLLFAGIKVLK